MQFLLLLVCTKLALNYIKQARRSKIMLDVSKITLATSDFNKRLTIMHIAHCLVQYWQIFSSFYIQLNPCNSNSYNSKDHLNRTNSSVPSEFTSNPLQENSSNSNSHNSKNHLNQKNFWVPGRIFHHVNRVLVSESSFFILPYSTVVLRMSQFECHNIRLLVADVLRMATKKKHQEVTLKVK